MPSSLHLFCIACICAALPLPATAQAAPFIDAGANLALNLVKVTVAFPACPQSPDSPTGKEGFAFVTGEDEAYIYLVTPHHLLSQRIPNGRGQYCYASQATLVFYDEAGKKSTSVTLPLAARHKPDADVSLFAVNKPPGWRNSYPNLASEPDMRRGATVTYLGYKGRPILSVDNGVLLDTCDQERVDACCLWLDKLHSQEGTSGAVVVDNERRVLGFILNQQRDEDIRAIRADEVRKIAAALKIPWNIYTKTEEEELGFRLNTAIEAGDTTAARSLISLYFNLDKKYPRARRTEGWPTLPIVIAANANRFDLVESMINHGSTDVSAAARVSVEAGRTDIVRLLIDKRLDASCVLGSALIRKNVVAADLLLSANLSRRFLDLDELCYDRASVIIALENGLPDMALKLLAQGASANGEYLDRVFHRGDALTLAILGNHRSVVSELLKRGANASYTTNSDLRFDNTRYTPALSECGVGPLHAAAYVGDLELVRLLISRGAVPDGHHASVVDLSSVINKSDCLTPFEAAILGGQLEIANYLYTQYHVSPHGYRGTSFLDYPSVLNFELHERTTLPAATKQAADALIATLSKSYCSTLKEQDFKDKGDYYIQRAHCSEREERSQ